LKRVERKGVLNMQMLVVRLLSLSSSSLKCAKGKVYNEKMQFAQTIIHDIHRIGTYAIDFLHKSRRSWCVKDQIRLGATLVDPVIKELKENKVVEQHFVEAKAT
jgi:hypothetical protein